MAEISPYAASPKFHLQTSRPPEVKHHPPPLASGVQEQAFNYFDMINLADDLAAIAAQLRRRTDVEKRSPNSGDPFDRILEDDAEAKVEQFLYISYASEINPQELLLQARSMFPDDSDLILVLREIIKRRKVRNEPTDVLEQVMEQVWAETNEKHCKAGLNVGIKAQVFASKMAVTAWALRDTYREFLESGDGEISQYEQWVEQYGNVRRYLVAEFIETALLHDIQSHDPSCSRAEFGALLGHLVTFKKLLASDKAFMEVFLKETQRGQVRRKEEQQESDHQGKGNQRGTDSEQEKQEGDQQTTPEMEALACWFDCLQRPFRIQREIEKNHLAQLTERLGLAKPVLQQKLLRAIKLLDGDLFFDIEAKHILIEALLNMDMKPVANPT
jgi:type III secretion protein W